MGINFSLKPKKYNTVVDYHSTLQQNETRINRVSGLIALVTLFSTIITLLLEYFGIFQLDIRQVIFVFLLIAPFCLLSFFISIIFRISKPWVKYVIVINECIIVLVLNTFFGIYAILLYVLPLLKSCLYYNRKLTITAAITTVVIMLLSHVLGVTFSLIEDDPMNNAVYDAVVYGFVPQLVQYVIICIIVSFLSISSSSMMKSLYGIASRNEQLVSDMRSSQYEIVNNLATISDNKSPETGDHIGRVFKYMNILAYASGYSKNDSYDIALASMLHDVGKLCIDEKIISAPRELTNEEFEIMKKHIVYGRDLLANSSSKVLQLGSKIAYEHHENYDGTGYLGLKGEEIDKFARMMSVVDVFDALTSTRSYKKAWSKQEALDELKRLKGTKFDPAVIDIFVANFESISHICDRLNPDSH